MPFVFEFVNYISEEVEVGGVLEIE